MPRSRAYAPLAVFLNGRRVGTLSRTVPGALYFQYAPDWLEWESAFPISLSLPMREDRYAGEPVIAVFENLLPDNDPIRRRLAERTGASGSDAYGLLAAVGRDCAGALQFLPEGEDPGPVGRIHAAPVDEARIARILTDLERTPLGVDTADDFRISIAGAEEKTALLLVDGQWHIPHGATPTSHILKPQIGNRGGCDLSQSVENEYLCMQLLQATGIPVANTGIQTFGSQRVLVVERFDRRWTADGRLLRLPQEDCCQALSVPPSRKYETDGGPGIPAVLELLKGSDRPLEAQESFLKAQVAFWLLGATDGHAKNFSLFLYPGAGFRLTPLYDVMSAQPLVAAGQVQRKDLSLAMAVGNNRHYRIHEVQRRHFEQTAARAGVAHPTAARVFEDLAEGLPNAVAELSGRLPADFPARIWDAITRGIEERLERLE